MSGHRFGLPLVLALAVLLLPFLPAPAAAQDPGGLYGDTLVVSVPATLDPDPLNMDPTNAVLHSLLYDALARPRASTCVLTCEPEPWLAMSWDVNLSANSVTFHIRPEAKWADGIPLTASHVAASYQRYVTALLLSGLTVSAPDPTTVVIQFTRGGGDFLGKWVALPIAFTNSTSPAKASGLFDLGASVPGVSLEITANPNHWHGRPYPDVIRYVFHTGASALDDAACDLIEKRADFLGFPLVFDDLTTPRPCGVLQGTGNASVPHIFTAIDSGFRYYQLGMNTQRAPLSDPVFRVALTSALDRDGVRGVEGLLATEVADSVVLPENSFWFNASVPRYRVEKQGTTAILDNVNDMLDRAGYLDRNGDGWREMPNGTSFALRFLHLSPTADPRFAKIDGITTNLNKVGINLVDVQISEPEILANVTADNFDLFTGTVDTGPDPSFLFDLFHSSRLAARNSNNVANATLDSRLEAVRDSLDLTTRQQAARDVQGWLGTNAAAAPLVHYRTVFVYNRERFEGWVDQPGGIDNFWSFAGLHVIQKGPLTVTVSPFTISLPSGGTTTVIVTVRDSEDNAVEDAEVVLSGGTFSPATGVTDSNGRLVAQFTAPAVTQTLDAAVRADATKPGYDSASATAGITVHTLVRRLIVIVDRGAVTTLEAGKTATINVYVTNTTGAPVADAAVTVLLSPSGVGGQMSPAAGTTAANGTFTTALTATVGAGTTFRITAVVTAAGYESATGSTSVIAKERGGTPPSAPGPDTVVMVVLVAGAAWLFARYQVRRRKQE